MKVYSMELAVCRFSACGCKGSILFVWEPNMFTKEHVFVHDNYVAVQGTWVAKQVKVFMVSVNFPQGLLCLFHMYSAINHKKKSGMLCSVFLLKQKLRMPMKEMGRLFMLLVLVLLIISLWTPSWLIFHSGGTKISKLDRFLISEGMMQVYPNNAAMVLQKGILDHSPILVYEKQVNYGPPSFRRPPPPPFVGLDAFKDVVKRTWVASVEGESNAIITFNIKSRVKWGVEGDENSSFSHSAVKHKIRQITIRGVSLEGDKSSSLEVPHRCKSPTPGRTTAAPTPVRTTAAPTPVRTTAVPQQVAPPQRTIELRTGSQKTTDEAESRSEQPSIVDVEEVSICQKIIVN
ncbi:hypothetical protein LXL04_021244 [Taraxacum kok-saghyz]